MRIAQVVPLYESTPPHAYGGTERVVALLSDALVELGHEVTLFACADASTKARRPTCRDQIRALHRIGRGCVREVFERRFTSRAMASSYAALYRRLLGGRVAA